MGNIIKKTAEYFSSRGIVLLLKYYKFYRNNIYSRSKLRENYDIILSVGSACRSAYYLKLHGFRHYANPLDWMMAYTLETVIHLYKTKFYDFFLDFYEDRSDTLHKRFVDAENHIISIHYEHIDDNQNFRSQMINRFARIEKALTGARNIAFMSNRRESTAYFEKFLHEAAGLYPGNITYINVRYNKKAETISRFEKVINTRLKIIEYEFNDASTFQDDECWIGNQPLWNEVMRNISITRPHNFFSWKKTIKNTGVKFNLQSKTNFNCVTVERVK